MAEQENTQPESMEDILSSIRETVEEEAATVEKQADGETAEDVDVDALMAQQPSEEIQEEAPSDDTLDLSDMLDEDEPQTTAPSDDVATPSTETEEVIDIAAFNATGEETPAEEQKAENARELYRGGEVDETIQQEASESKVEEPVIEEKEEIAVVEEKTEESKEQQVEEITEVATEALASTVAKSSSSIQLPTSPSADGLQVTFPVEVLAAALRPLVKDWVTDNLPSVVERLVKEELSKLANQ